MAFMGSHSLMLTRFNKRADVLQWLSAELYVTALLAESTEAAAAAAVPRFNWIYANPGKL